MPGEPRRSSTRAVAAAFAAAAAVCACASPAAGGVEKTSIDCDYYASPTREGGGEIPEDGAWGSSASFTAGSFGEPGSIRNFWGKAKPGDVLCLRSGTYRGEDSMIFPPRGFGGRPGRPITVRALSDGDVWIDGGNVNSTVGITGSHWVLEGFNVYDSVSGIIGIDGRKTPASDIVIRRVVAWRNPGRSYKNAMNIDISFGEDVLVEDVACFGTARKCVQVHRSMRVTLRRVWARWDGRWPYSEGNQFAISPMYRSFDSLAENVIATSGGDDQTGYTPRGYDAQGLWLIGTDAVPSAEDVERFAPGRDRHDVRLRLLGSIAYSKPGQRFVSHGVLMNSAGLKGSVEQDLVVSVPAGSKRVIINHACLDNDQHCRWRAGDLPNRATRLTLVGGPPNTRTKWKLNEFEATSIRKVDVQQPIDIFTPGGSGASVCFEYVDGKLTSRPLWPWPMNARILAATRKSGWGEADVTADIEKVFGPIPARCLRGSAS